MLQGVVPFPPEFAQRYRERGYWQDKSLAEEFKPVFERYADRVAIIDRERFISYAELDRLSGNLALNLLDAGLKPLDRVVVQLPNVAEFVILYFALQKIGCIPIAALPAHRHTEITSIRRAFRRHRLRNPRSSARLRFRRHGKPRPSREPDVEIWIHRRQFPRWIASRLRK